MTQIRQQLAAPIPRTSADNRGFLIDDSPDLRGLNGVQETSTLVATHTVGLRPAPVRESKPTDRAISAMSSGR